MPSPRNVAAVPVAPARCVNVGCGCEDRCVSAWSRSHFGRSLGMASGVSWSGSPTRPPSPVLGNSGSPSASYCSLIHSHPLATFVATFVGAFGTRRTLRSRRSPTTSPSAPRQPPSRYCIGGDTEENQQMKRSCHSSSHSSKPCALPRRVALSTQPPKASRGSSAGWSARGTRAHVSSVRSRVALTGRAHVSSDGSSPALCLSRRARA